MPQTPPLPSQTGAQPRQRILCVAFPCLSTDRIARLKWGRSWRLNQRPAAPPIVVTDMVKSAIRIIAHEADVKGLGIFCGQTLSDARALVPALDCFACDRAADEALLISVAAWCGRYTPLVAADTDHDGLFLDVTGCAHLFGTEADLVDDVRRRLTAQGLTVCLCLADTAGAAWAVARYGTTQIVGEGEHRRALEGLPVAALRLEEGVASGLDRVGLKTICAIAELPRAPLAARFGKHLLQRLDQALGREREAVSPLIPIADLAAEKRLAEPIVYEDDIHAVIGRLAANLAEPLAERGQGLRACCLRLFRVDGHVASLSVEASAPLRDPGRIARLFRERLAGLHDDLDAGFGFDVIRLEVTRAETFDAAQVDLVDGDATGEDHAALVDRLSARLGADRVRCFVQLSTHIPERSFAAVPVMQAVAARRMDKPPAPLVEEARSALTRPLILFAEPEPVEAVAEVPDGPPLRFRWRKAFYEVARAEGPERIACEWWRDGRAARTRDYFRVEDSQGHRFWLFRHGLYDRETNEARWYMHGLFS